MTLGELIKGLLLSQEGSMLNTGAIFNAQLMTADGNPLTFAKLSTEHPREEGDLYIFLQDKEV